MPCVVVRMDDSIDRMFDCLVCIVYLVLDLVLKLFDPHANLQKAFEEFRYPLPRYQIFVQKYITLNLIDIYVKK